MSNHHRFLGGKFIYFTIYLFSCSDLYTIYHKYAIIQDKGKTGYQNKPGYGRPRKNHVEISVENQDMKTLGYKKKDKEYLHHTQYIVNY